MYITMKKLFLLVAVVAMFLPGCTKLEESIDALADRVDKLEQSIPTIEEQITAIQASITSLEEVDAQLKEKIMALEASDKASAEEITVLKAKDTELGQKIRTLQDYVESLNKSTKDWVTTTFATLEQFNSLSTEVANLKTLLEQYKNNAATNLSNAISALETSMKSWVGEQLANYYTIAEVNAKIEALESAITDGDTELLKLLDELKSQLTKTAEDITAAYKKAIEEAINTNNGIINAKIANEIAAVNQRIDNEVAAINANIAALQAQVDKNTEDITKLLARIQSVTYLPEYSDGIATINHLGHLSEVTLDFKVSPKESAEELAKVWQTAVSCEALYTKTRAASLAAMPAIAFEVDAERGVITVIASGENLSEEFFAGTQDAKIALVISDGNNSITSDYIPMVAKEITNEIWYTSLDGKVVEPNMVEGWGANILSNTYHNGKGKIIFDGPITDIAINAFKEIRTLKTITLPNGIMYIGANAFASCNYMESITLPACLYGIYDSAFHQCYTLTELTIPDSVVEIATTTFFSCSNLQYIYSKFSTPDNMSLVVDGVLNWVSPKYPSGDYIIPDGVKSIGNYAINYPQNVITVTIPDSVESFTGNHPFIGVYNISAFYGKYVVDNRHVIKDGFLYGAAVHGLTEYDIPEGVTGTGYRVFRSCTFEKVTLPASLKKINDKLFDNCDNLHIVYCKAVLPPDQDANWNIFNSCSQIPTIYVPHGSVNLYKTANGWSKFADRIVGYDF